jgi:uncharacterized protein (TIGR02246 family)
MRLLGGLVATVLIVGLLNAADDPLRGAPAKDKQSEEQAIRTLLADLEKAWNAHNIKAFMAQIAEDADVVNRFGLWMKGRADVEKHLVELHASPFRDHLVNRSSQVEQVRFITPDVAVAHERTKEESGQSVRTYVLQKRDGRWWVQSADIVQQGTPHP